MRKRGDLRYALKCGAMVLGAYILTAIFFDDPGFCCRAVRNGEATWREWCGAGFYLLALCAGGWLIADKKKK